MSDLNKDIERYYDASQPLYSIFWSGSMHYGFWEKNTKKLSDALNNTNMLVANLLDINANSHVLDAGCGLGKSSFFMAKSFGAKVTGITLSKKQSEQATRDSERLGISNLVNFQVMDFTKMKFKDKTFSGIFGIESFCHAEDKGAALGEAYRVLKSGGRIVVDDGFLTKRNLSPHENDIYRKCLVGWKVPNLSHKDDFLKLLKKAGFRDIKFIDKTSAVMPSSRRIAFYGYLFFPVSFLLSKLKIMPKNLHENSVCMINQRRTFRNFALYGVFVARK